MKFYNWNDKLDLTAIDIDLILFFYYVDLSMTYSSIGFLFLKYY